MTSTRIIFLDIDGVLNHQLMYKEKDQATRHQEAIDKGHPWSAGDIDPISISYLNNLIERTGAKVVISSSWRRSGIEYCKNALEYAGFKGEVIDITPSLNYPGAVRGNEIKAWIDSNIKHISPSDYKEYVILDDDSDMLLWQRENFIIVDGYCGLTPNQCYKAEFILDRNLTFSGWVDKNKQADK